MKKYLIAALAVAGCSGAVLAQTHDKLTSKEKKDGYVLLFNGKTTDGWHRYNKADAGAWKVVDGALQLDTAEHSGRGDIITNGEYENFELKLEWRIAQGGNSGIIFPVHEDKQYAYTFLTGMEMQVLDDIKAEDNKQENHLAGSLYDMIAPSHHAKPAGEWNAVTIRKENGHITFWLNGEKVVEVQMGSDEWNKLIANSKFKNWKGFATYPKGHIALQDHGAMVAYRDIRIKQL